MSARKVDDAKAEVEEILERMRRRENLKKPLTPLQTSVLRLISRYKRRTKK